MGSKIILWQDKYDFIVIAPMTASAEDRALILRRSLEMRCELTRSAFVGVVLVTLVAALNLAGRVPIGAIAGWVLPLLLAHALRDTFAQHVLKNVRAPGLEPDRLHRWDVTFRASSMLNQFIAGSPVWFVAPHGGTEDALFLTLVSGLYAVGATTNLACDPKTVYWSVPLVMIHPVLFWFGQGRYGWTILATLMLISVLMMLFARRHGRIFEENVLIAARMDAAMRDKDTALKAMDVALHEKNAALEAADEARNEQARAMRAKSMFLAAASHDLRQPLYAMSLLGDTLAYEPLGENARSIVTQQKRIMEALKLLFDNLLDLSRFESGDMDPPSISAVPVRGILRQMEAEFAPQCSVRELRWTLHECDGVVCTDPVMLVRLLRNLLWNAVRYTEKGFVELGASQQGDSIRLWVNDSGPGIPIEDHDRVFQEFVQLGRDKARRESGVGLGLAIVRYIKQALDIPLFLRSSEGKGTRFTLVLRAGAGPSTQALAEDRGNTLPVLSPAMRAACIWIVEDDHAVRSALDLHMRTIGLNCRISSSAEEYRSALVAGPMPKAVIFDDMLGEGETGFDLACDLLETHPEIPVLIATAGNDSARLDRIRNHGLTLVQKPARVGDLVAWLQSVIDSEHG